MAASLNTLASYICGPTWDQRIVNIPLGHQSVGILMSGGLDSWVLYSLLIKHIDPEQLNIFNIKRPDGIDSASKIRDLTNRSDVVEIDLVDTVKKSIDVVIDLYPNTQIFTAVNIIPHTDYFPEFGDDERPRRPWKIDWPSVNVPFHHLYKYHIIDLAVRNGIDVSNTSSCTRLPNKHCGECWQCRERRWGFEQLNLEDAQQC